MICASLASRSFADFWVVTVKAILYCKAKFYFYFIPLLHLPSSRNHHAWCHWCGSSARFEHIITPPRSLLMLFGTGEKDKGQQFWWRRCPFKFDNSRGGSVGGAYVSDSNMQNKKLSMRTPSPQLLSLMKDKPTESSGLASLLFSSGLTPVLVDPFWNCPMQCKWKIVLSYVLVMLAYSNYETLRMYIHVALMSEWSIFVLFIDWNSWYLNVANLLEQDLHQLLRPFLVAIQGAVLSTWATHQNDANASITLEIITKVNRDFD